MTRDAALAQFIDALELAVAGAAPVGAARDCSERMFSALRERGAAAHGEGRGEGAGLTALGHLEPALANARAASEPMLSSRAKNSYCLNFWIAFLQIKARASIPAWHSTAVGARDCWRTFPV